MSENNDGGLAERGGTSNVSGTGSNFGGSGGPTGSGGSNSGNVGVNMGTVSDKSAGVSSTGSSTKKSNIVSTYGELLPGARAPVVPGFNYTNRKNQTLQDIQQQNMIGNQNYANSQQNNGSNNAGGQTQYTTKRVQRKNPKTGVLETVTVKVPVTQPPFDPLSGIQVPPNPNYMDYQGYGTWPKHPIADYGLPTNYGQPVNIPSPPHTDPYGTPGGGWPGTRNEAAPAGSVGGDYGGSNNYGGQRQFGGPVEPGQSYTVGENGPETLQMGPGGGGQVVPHNPADRLGGMNPQMMQQWFQMMRQRAQQPRPQMPPQQMPQRPPTQPPWQMPPTGQMGPPPQQMGQRPPMQGGFGLSQLGQPGVLGRLRQNQGMG